MALHDFKCPRCGFVLRDYNVPIAVGARGARLSCHSCSASGVVTILDWIPQVGRMDAGSGSSFVAFETEVMQPDGSHKRVRVGSLNDLRKIERESADRQRNGEGQAMIWRDYSQDRSNFDVHTMGPDPGVKAREELASLRQSLDRPHRGSTSAGRLTESEAEAVPLGGGVSDATVSALTE